jgi:hypothetical protein
VHVPLELQREETEATDSCCDLDATSQQATSFYSMQSGHSSRSTSNHSACLTSAAATAGSGDKTKQLYINASFAEQPGKPRSSTSSSRSSRYGSSPYSNGGQGQGSKNSFSSGGKRSSLSGHSKPSGLKSVAEKDSCLSGSRGFPHLLLILLMVFTAVGVGVGVWAGVTDILGKQQRAAEAAAAAAAVALDVQGAAGGPLRFRTVMELPSSLPSNASCGQWFGGAEVSWLWVWFRF